MENVNMSYVKLAEHGKAREGGQAKGPELSQLPPTLAASFRGAKMRAAATWP